jgi:uncharacterized protein YjbI with pentapeptide repeats
MTARHDSSFNAAVYGTMAQFILKTSRAACRPEGAKEDRDTELQYEMPPELARITQIFAGNNSPDPWGAKTNMVGACLSRAQLRQSNGLQQLYLKDAKLIGAEFVGSNLSRSVLDHAKGGIELVTNWWNANRDRAEAGGYEAVAAISYGSGSYAWANFQDANLEDVSAIGANLKGALFYSASMVGSQWRAADLSFANLLNADLRNTGLQGTELRGANLEAANLKNADLTGAKLSGANLTRAFFANTNVTGADFRKTNLKSGQLSGMCVNEGQARPDLPPDIERIDLAVCYQNPFSRWVALSRATLAQSR